MKNIEGNKSTPYSIGRLVAVLEKVHGEPFKASVFDSMMNCPTYQIGSWFMLLNHKIEEETNDLISDIMWEIDVEDFNKQIILCKDKGSFWLGYYHQRSSIGGDN